MARKPAKVLRCAIYTRKSTEHGLELEFNSLDAQREACEAYIKSQASQGWVEISKRYDDPAYSGGNIDRPALQKLLKDIAAGQIDVVVVYKIDRLTRSLADFAKLVEIFDAKSVSFVAVTQQFNTTTSMGRLTLNVLLSFAQFERELASERVRDKVAASRKKGKWTGGSVPLGYDVKDKKLVVNPSEAKIVRTIFTRYLALKSFQKLIDELDDKGIVTKKRPLADKIAGRNSVHVRPPRLSSEKPHLSRRDRPRRALVLRRARAGHRPPDLRRGSTPSEDKQCWQRGRRQKGNALLAGLLFDDHGNRMSPSYSIKRGVRYPFYVSSALLRGRKSQAGSVPRVSAAEIEAAVMIALRTRSQGDDSEGLSSRNLVEQKISRVVVQAKRLKITLKGVNEIDELIEAPWSAKSRDFAQIKDENGSNRDRAPNPHLVQALVRAHAWLRLLSTEKYNSINALAAAVDVHPKVIRNRIRLAFLAPTLTSAILKGSQPATLNLQVLNRAIPMHWNE